MGGEKPEKEIDLFACESALNIGSQTDLSIKSSQNGIKRGLRAIQQS
jgi:hypothetical protein